jgi:hypothetical protein
MSHIVSLHDKFVRLQRKDLVNVQSDAVQMTVFQEQQLTEVKSSTTTVRIRSDIMLRLKKLARDNRIKNHGKLLNLLLDEVLIKLEDGSIK